jgi:hypothetical protein
MHDLEMSGTYLFTFETIDKIVVRKSPGNYALGFTNDNGTFIVQYVGRSDTDLNQELKKKYCESYKKFKFSYAESPKDAYEKECQNYHDFGQSVGLHNTHHPAPQDGAGWKCPVCSFSGKQKTF